MIHTHTQGLILSFKNFVVYLCPHNPYWVSTVMLAVVFFCNSCNSYKNDVLRSSKVGIAHNFSFVLTGFHCFGSSGTLQVTHQGTSLSEFSSNLTYRTIYCLFVLYIIYNISTMWLYMSNAQYYTTTLLPGNHPTLTTTKHRNGAQVQWNKMKLNVVTV